jgi:2-C-methyl-D-erythritol 4-phosphate cytidylyltransferase
MRIYNIVVAGGNGSRMKSELPKQFLLLNNKPILYYSLKVLTQIPESTTILVIHPDYRALSEEITSQIHPDIKIIIGGATRFHSVQNGINAILNADPNDLVLVHDAARPLIDLSFITALIQSYQSGTCTVPVVSIAESTRVLTDSGNKSIDRNSLRTIQTPQVASVQLMKEGFSQEYVESFTDEASVLEQIGYPVHLVEGSPMNIKITTFEQMQIAELWIQKLFESIK